MWESVGTFLVLQNAFLTKSDHPPLTHVFDSCFASETGAKILQLSCKTHIYKSILIWEVSTATNEWGLPDNMSPSHQEHWSPAWWWLWSQRMNDCVCVCICVHCQCASTVWLSWQQHTSSNSTLYDTSKLPGAAAKGHPIVVLSSRCNTVSPSRSHMCYDRPYVGVLVNIKCYHEYRMLW